MIKDRQVYIEKVQILQKMEHSYYVLDNPIASDDEYDRLYHEVEEYEKLHAQYIDPSSPTQRVGSDLRENIDKIQHLERMWSLDDVFNREELELWINRINKNNNDYVFMCDAKFDGASLNLTYDDGILVSAATRGDGNVGENVLENAKTIGSIPLKINYKEKIEIRGEVIIDKDDFEKLNKKRAENNESIFANPRNAASGSLRQLDPNITKERKLKFIPWGFGYYNNSNDSFYERLMIIKNLGFIDTKLHAKCNNIDEIERFYNKLNEIRHTYNIMLDGMVVRIDSIKIQNSLGYTAKHPRFAVAYKFPPIEKQTKIIDIKFRVGRTGVVTPVAELEKVNIDGVYVSKATLHNFDEIEKKDIMIGDTVLIIRSGDVIPKIIKPIKECRVGSEIKVEKPANCPVCQSKLFIENVLIKCHNLNCRARIKNSITHFCSKKAMDIVGLGDKVVEFLLNEGIIKNILDIYKIKKEQLTGKEGWKEKKINNLLQSIENSKNTNLWRLINALGIEHIGEGVSKKIASTFGAEIFNTSMEELLRVGGIGQESAQSIISFTDTNKDLINELMDIIQPKLESSHTMSILSGEVIVLTGTMSRSRHEIQEILEQMGAEVSNSVGRKTTMLIIGENPGSKLDKAMQLGIRILEESQLNEIINTK